MQVFFKDIKYLHINELKTKAFIKTVHNMRVNDATSYIQYILLQVDI